MGGTLDNKMNLCNPPSVRFISMIVIVSSIAILLGLILLDGSISHAIGSMILLSYGTLAIILVAFRELIHRPKSIMINDDGIVLTFRFTKQRFLKWCDVHWILATEGDYSTTIGRWDRDGAIKPINGYFYSLTYEVANEIKNAYRKNTGKYPMTKEEFLKTKNE